MRTEQPRATIALVGVTTAAYFIVSASPWAHVAPVYGGFIPIRLLGAQLGGAAPALLTPLTAALLHGGVIHLVFNMLMLAYGGRQVEAALGRWGLVLLYLVGAYAAAAAQFAVGPTSAEPMIGASGAVSAVIGAYALLYGQRRPLHADPRLSRALNILWLAAAWFVVQLLLGYASATRGVAIATAAHIGGFVAGLLMARPLLRWRYRGA